MVAAVLTGYLVKIYRLWVPEFSSEAKSYRLVYRAVLDRLSDQGLTRKPGESRESFAARVADIYPAFGEITRRHLAEALGTAEHRKHGTHGFDWKQASTDVKRQLRQKTPWWKTFLATMNPYSWLATR